MKLETILRCAKAIEWVTDITDKTDKTDKTSGEKAKARAKRLLLGTAAVESDFEHWSQVHGPAVSYWQVEPKTGGWLMTKYPWFFNVIERGERLLPDDVWSLLSSGDDDKSLKFFCLLARLRYKTDPEPIPDSVYEQACYWKKIYNTKQGKGVAKDFVVAWAQHRLTEWCQILGWGVGRHVACQGDSGYPQSTL